MNHQVIFYDSRKHLFSKYLQKHAEQKEKWTVKIISHNKDYQEECNLIPAKKIPFHTIVSYLQTHMNDLIPNDAIESYFIIGNTKSTTITDDKQRKKMRYFKRAL